MDISEMVAFYKAGDSLEKIANKAGVSRGTVARRIRGHIKIRKRGEEKTPRELGPEWAAENGYIKDADLAVQAEQDARSSELTSALDDGINRYGDAFGSRVEGRFVLNEEAKAKMASVYARLVKNLPEGIQFPGTVLDVFEITFGGGRRTSEQERVDSILGASGVANGSAGGGTGSLAWYKPGESLGKTIRKAAALATREVNSRR